MTDPAKILVVDDDENIRVTLVAALQEEGYIVDEAKNGKEAIAKSYADFYNLAIIDWRLPDIEGTKLLTEMKETTPKMAKIMFTGYPSMNNAIESVNNHADAFLRKPVNFNVLLSKIKELLKQQEQTNMFDEGLMVNFIETRAKQVLRSEKTGPTH